MEGGLVDDVDTNRVEPAVGPMHGVPDRGQ